MQIIFDTSRDDAQCMRDMIDAYIQYQQKEPESLPVRTALVGKGTNEGQLVPVSEQAERILRRVESPTVLDPVFVKDAPVSFTPGDLGAPSPADAAPSPTAPEVSTAGVPVPPSVASVPAPPSTVPEVPAAPTISAPSGDLDIKGLPWDERIHAGTKAKNADGSWRQRRGLNDPALVARVEAELRARAANPGNAALGDDAAKLASLGMDPMSGQPFPTGGYVPAPPPMAAGGTAANVPPPPVVATPPAPAAPDALTYDGFLAWVTPKMMDGSTPFDKVAAALSASGVSSPQELRDNPAAIPAVYAALGGV